MKVHVTNKDGAWSVDYETEPMPESRFRLLCGIVYALIASGALLGFFALLTR